MQIPRIAQPSFRIVAQQTLIKGGRSTILLKRVLVAVAVASVLLSPGGGKALAQLAEDGGAVQSAPLTPEALQQPVAASKAEILFRRIGRNELQTIQLCRDHMLFILALYQFGPLLPPANTEDYAKKAIEPRPIYGYYYRILNKQGRHAPGGAKNYIVNGRMTGGFAFVAYPAEYRSSGVMTFIINLDGIVYQKDLGQRTAVRARALTQFDPDATWKKVE